LKDRAYRKREVVLYLPRKGMNAILRILLPIQKRGGGKAKDGSIFEKKKKG